MSGKVYKNDGALLADLKRGIRRWCEQNLLIIIASAISLS